MVTMFSSRKGALQMTNRFQSTANNELDSLMTQLKAIFEQSKTLKQLLQTASMATCRKALVEVLAE